MLVCPMLFIASDLIFEESNAEFVWTYKWNWFCKLWFIWSLSGCWSCKWYNQALGFRGGKKYDYPFCALFIKLCRKKKKTNILTILYCLNCVLCSLNSRTNVILCVVVRTLTGHRSNCISVDFHPFGEFFASGSLDTNLKIWDIRKKGCIHTYKGHTRGVNAIRFTPDGRWVVSGGEDNTVKVITAFLIFLYAINAHKATFILIRNKTWRGLCLCPWHCVW